MPSFGQKSYEYNVNGDLKKITDSATNQVTQLTYDQLGHLKVFVSPTKHVRYTIDAFDRRIYKKDANNDIQVIYEWNTDDQLVATLDGSQVLDSIFVYASQAHSPDYMIKGNVNYHIVKDHLGSPVQVINASTGAIVQEVKYDEWGNILSDTNPGFTPFGFAGCLYDQDTKLCRFGARDYDASIGRWLSKDPILFEGGDTNLYGYVMQDPVNWIDSDGLKMEMPHEKLGPPLDFYNPGPGGDSPLEGAEFELAKFGFEKLSEFLKNNTGPKVRITPMDPNANKQKNPTKVNSCL